MTGHTPGPWIAHEVGNIWLILSLDEKARAAGLPSIAVDNKVDAHIIAAAPELLDLAKLLERSLVYEIKKCDREDDEEGARLKFLTLAQVRAAIAKTEGRS